MAVGNNKKKILLLIKSHDRRFADYYNDLYEELEAINFKYMSNENLVDFYYVKGNPEQTEEVNIDEIKKIVWVKSQEDYTGHGLKNKLLSALDYLINFQKRDHDHIFIANMSTIVNAKLLSRESEGVKLSECAAYLGLYSWRGETYNFPSGAGQLLGVDLVKKVLSHSKKVNHEDYPSVDDIFLGLVLKKLGCSIKQMNYFEIREALKGELTEHQKSMIEKHTHIRVKFPRNRVKEAYLHKKIYELIYTEGNKKT